MNQAMMNISAVNEAKRQFNCNIRITAVQLAAQVRGQYDSMSQDKPDIIELAEKIHEFVQKI